MNKVHGFSDTYLLRKKNHSRRTKRHSKNLTKQLSKDKRVVWAEQQIARVRVKRGFLIDVQKIWSDPLERGKKEPFPFDDHTFNDELWKHQWYLHDTRNVPTLPELDLKVRQVIILKL